MKKFKFIAFCLVGLLLLMIPTVTYAQDTGPVVEPIQSLADYVQTFAAYCAACVVAAAFVMKSISVKITLLGWQKYLIAFIVSLIIGAAAFLLKFGIFATTILNALVYIIGGFLMAAGLFKLPMLETLLAFLKIGATKTTNISK